MGTENLDAADSKEDLLSEGALGDLFKLTQTLDAKGDKDIGEPEVKAEVEEPLPVVKVAPEAKAEAKPEAKVEPEKVEPEKEQRAPLTKFAVFDEEGELTPDIDLKFKFDAAGKPREVPLDKLVLLAQMGFYNQEREDRVKDADSFKVTAEQQLTRYAAAVQRLSSEYANIFEDPSYYEAARTAYFQENSPERRAEKAETQLRDYQTQQTKVAEQAEANLYVANTLTPVFESLLKTYPTVSYEELMGRFSVLTTPLVASGVPLRQRLSETKRILDSELTHWVQSKHLERDVERKAKDAELTGEKTRTMLAKRQMARAVQPRGQAAPATPALPTNFNSAAEWLNTVLPSAAQED